ncbi:DEAD/DEAH box helicase [Paenibacillus sp. An7]|uniref:DEAD/DEAH box helicase n=1 Tax=Paenibacillus sp. An7 TaxID=2689577 RepID=UPI001358E37B|nr:DEAD/DEAH box helicase [Paenibacillus sp. An7]
MNQPLYGIWLGDVFFCFSGETSEPRVDAWSHGIRKMKLKGGTYRPFQHAALRLAELRWQTSKVQTSSADPNKKKRMGMGRTLEGLALSPKDAFELLIHWNKEEAAGAGFEAGEEMEYWSKAALFALELLLRGQIAPGVAPVTATGGRRRGNQSAVKGAWHPRLREKEDIERFAILAESIPPIALTATVVYADTEAGSVKEAGAAVLYSFLSQMIHAAVSSEIAAVESSLSKYRVNYRRGYSPLSELWWNSLLTGSRELSVQGTIQEIEELSDAVSEAGESSPPSIENESSGPAAGKLRLGLRLEPSEAGSEWNVSFWAESETESDFRVPIEAIWSHPSQEVDRGTTLYESVQEQMLREFGKACELAPALGSGWNGPPTSVRMNTEMFYDFMAHAVPKLQKSGVTVMMPSRWSKEGKRKTGLKLKMLPHPGRLGSVKRSSTLGMEQLVAFEAEVVLDGIPVSQEELARLAASTFPLVEFRGEWIEIDPKEIRQVLRFMKKNEEGTMALSEWMHLVAEDEEDANWKGLSIFGAESYGMLSFLLEGQVLKGIEPKSVPPSLHGNLRPYQERGFQWLSAMRDLGFGVCLADDMGLGKTIQVITCLLDSKLAAKEIREAERKLEGMVEDEFDTEGPALIVCPTSLLGNWQRELARFAPDFKLYIHHGTQRLHGDRFREQAEEHDIVLTTYHLAGRDGADLASVHWSSVVLDEAQYIKNYRTKQAQSVMKLSAPHRIAMTGTPVENRLSELWSIFQFLNPGYLGTAASFRQRYVTGGEEGAQSLRELHKLVSPFMLRRLKSDPDIRKDLPEKLELKSYCSLTVEQTALYKGVVDQLLTGIEGQTGFTRKGVVLSSLTKLKQICDHPVLLEPNRKEQSGRVELSGKLERLMELTDAIRDNGESALIFTQYVSMGDILVNQLTQRYNEKPFFLHGGISKAERDAMVDRFQKGEGPSIFVLSLRAGGVGLNLTHASHVIHYDRWWNPAVENQATDRVFRIGQKRNVQVHKLICQGTLEERIDELIESKKQLSEQVVGSGENWLTEMSDDELKGLVTLQGEMWM